MTKNILIKVGKPAIEALNKFNQKISKMNPSKDEVKERLESEAESSVDIEYPGSGLHGVTS